MILWYGVGGKRMQNATLKFSLLISFNGEEHSIPYASHQSSWGKFLYYFRVCFFLWKALLLYKETSWTFFTWSKIKVCRMKWLELLIYSQPPRNVIRYLHVTLFLHSEHFAKDLNRFMFIFILPRHTTHDPFKWKRFSFSSRQFGYSSSEMWMKMCCVVDEMKLSCEPKGFWYILSWVIVLKSDFFFLQWGERRRRLQRGTKTIRDLDLILFGDYFSLLPIACLLWVLYSYTYSWAKFFILIPFFLFFVAAPRK